MILCINKRIVILLEIGGIAAAEMKEIGEIATAEMIEIGGIATAEMIEIGGITAAEMIEKSNTEIEVEVHPIDVIARVTDTVVLRMQRNSVVMLLLVLVAM